MWDRKRAETLRAATSEVQAEEVDRIGTLTLVEPLPKVRGGA